jgi:hypothetical protein
MLFLWFFHACRRGSPRFLMVADHVNYLTFEDPGAVNTVRRALKLAEAGDLHGSAEAAGVDPAHASVVSEALRRGMRFSLGAEVDNDPRARPDAQNIIDAMRPDGIIRCISFLTIDHPEKGPDFNWSFDDDEFAPVHESVGTERLWELYVAKFLDDLEKLPAHIAGNFYAPARLGGWPAPERLEEYEDRLLAVCHARKLSIEVNTRFLYRDTSDEIKKRFMDANARLARKAQALGVGIAIGSDAHSPKDQGNQFDLVLRMLDDAGINELVFPVAGRLARVALRATQEHLDAHARSREKNVPGSSISGFGRAELGLPEQSDKRGSPTSRETAAKRRAGGPARATKRATGASSKSSSKSTSKRSADSTQSSTQAKAARTEPEGEAKPESPPAKPAKAPKTKAAAKPPAPKSASRSKVAAKPAPVRKAAEKAKPPEKPKLAEKVRADKAKPARATSSKSTAAASSKSAPAAKSKSAAPAKRAASSSKPAAARKKTPVKKVVKAPARAAATKKTAKKAPVKPASRPAAHGAKSAPKTAKKNAVKKPAKSAAATSSKKKPTPKHR